jgi:hypothetical protein
MPNCRNSASLSLSEAGPVFAPHHSPWRPGAEVAAFLQNHREVLAAMDFFTVPTMTFRVLYCFFVIEHERRKVLH